MKSLKLSLLAAVGAFFFVSTAATAQTTAKAAPAAQAKNMKPRFYHYPVPKFQTRLRHPPLLRLYQQVTVYKLLT